MPDGQNIHVLSDELQNQIAAGEVVERPASVLKELLENSLDSGADRIEVELQAGGQSLIKVVDNGQGMSAQELPLALTRHATSKINSYNDLLKIASFGFRGEALPSIASVSKLRLASITDQAQEGYEIRAEWGKIIEQRPSPLREGTQVEIRDLFLNTPARLKFLKKQTTENKHCLETVKRFALSCLKTEFMVTTNQRPIFHFPKNQSLEDRLAHLWPPQIIEGLIPVTGQDDDYYFQGILGDPNTAQGNTGRIVFFVNKRPVQDKLLFSALRQAYRGKLLTKEHPQAVLFLDIPYEQVDVNVHPAKAEVRFRDEHRIFSLIAKGAEKALNKYNRVTELSQSETEKFEKSSTKDSDQVFRTLAEWEKKSSSFETSSDPSSFPHNMNLKYPGDFTAQQKTSQPCSSFEPVQEYKTSFGLNYLGQLEKTYLLLMDEDTSLLIIDQHAAHERILFNSFMNQSSDQTSQHLMLPLELKLHPEQINTLEKIGPQLRRLGFGFERPEKETLLIRRIPDYLSSGQAKEIVQQALNQRAFQLEDLWILTACRKAIKAGEALSPSEALHLLEEWWQSQNRAYCPHGRPVSIRFSGQDLEKFFKRGK